MKQIFLLVQLASVLLFALPPFLCYMRKGKQFYEFYVWMATFSKARRLYRIAFAMQVTLFNFAAIDVMGPDAWLIPGMLLAVFLLTDKCTAAIFRRIHDDRRIQGLAFSVFLFTLAIPQLFTLSITIGMTIIAAMFYPSWGLTIYLRFPERFEEPPFDKQLLIKHLYFYSIPVKEYLSFLDE